MAQLSEIMISKAESLLLRIYREPSVTAYNRLEPRPRSENFERSLRAEVRDGLWMLTRQWQMGELESEDAGSAIDARLVTKQIHVDRIALQGNNGTQYNEMIPMETMVECETIPFTYALSVQIGQYFLQLHTSALRTKYLTQYLSFFGFEQNLEDMFKGQNDGLSLYIATKKRAIDGEKLYKSILNNTFNTIISVDAADNIAMNDILDKLQKWFNRQYFQPAKPEDSAWHPQQLDYQFSIAAPDNNNTQTVMHASQYYQGKLDWYAFDEDLRSAPLTTDNPSPSINVEDNNPISFLPINTSFKGMPNPRFWEMEDRQINFGKLNAKTTDHLLLLFAEFGLIYDNDWFVIPYKIPVNTLCEIKGFVVTDVFGDRTLIQAADQGSDNNWQKWSMFNLSNKDHMGNYNRQFFLPSSLTQTLESDPIEKVNFIRDDTANMVWGIEDIIPDATNKGINGNEAADKTGVEPPPITNSTAKIRYILGTTVPENWIPFLPVHIPGSNQSIYFQRAAMPKLGNPPKDVVKAKGVLLNEVQPHYFINEEEILYSGTIITRTYQRTRWYNGKTYVWIGRYRETGRGPGNSDLRFDQIDAL
jgi:hypothetical protein